MYHAQTEESEMAEIGAVAAEYQGFDHINLSAVQGHNRTMQMLADNSLELNKQLSMNSMNLQTRGLKPIVELDVSEGLGISTALTRIDPSSQVANASRDGTLTAMLTQILANTSKG